MPLLFAFLENDRNIFDNFGIGLPCYGGHEFKLFGP